MNVCVVCERGVFVSCVSCVWYFCECFVGEVSVDVGVVEDVGLGICVDSLKWWGIWDLCGWWEGSVCLGVSFSVMWARV